jgi:NAD(P)H dehydrogenase (quinone)
MAMPNQYSIAQQAAFEQHAMQADIVAEQDKLRWCDLLLIQFPLWWFSVPAILKGWFDRVFTKGFAYDAGQWFNTAPLFGRKAMLVATTQAPEISYQASGLNGDINTLLQPIHHTLHFVGFSVLAPFMAYGVMDNQQLRQQYLKSYPLRLRGLEQASVNLPVPIIAAKG